MDQAEQLRNIIKANNTTTQRPVARVITVTSGKGGVGKSSVTDLLAVAFAKKGYHCGILDADVTGPSIPKAFGITAKATSDETTMFTVRTEKLVIDVM